MTVPALLSDQSRSIMRRFSGCISYPGESAGVKACLRKPAPGPAGRHQGRNDPSHPTAHPTCPTPPRAARDPAPTVTGSVIHAWFQRHPRQCSHRPARRPFPPGPARRAAAGCRGACIPVTVLGWRCGRQQVRAAGADHAGSCRAVATSLMSRTSARIDRTPPSSGAATA